MAKLFFITANDAANSLVFYANYQDSIYVNVHTDQVCLKDLVGVIEKRSNSKVKYASQISESNHSPYGVEKSWGLDISQAIETGFKPEGNILNLIEKLVRKND